MGNWYCLYTKPKIEDHVSERLMNVPDIEVFNPKTKIKKYVRGSVKEVAEEFFPCYIFSRFDPARHYHMIKYTRGVKQIVGDASGNPYAVADEIIEHIQSKIKNGFITETVQLKKGDRVQVREGPLKGFEGIFQDELKARDRVMILLNTIACQAGIEIDKGMLVKI